MERSILKLGILAAGMLAIVNVASAAAPALRYVLTAETVFDTKTSLTWQREVPAQGYAQVADASLYCQSLALAGGGWRLPTIKELHTLLDVRDVDVGVDQVAFPNTPTSAFWSSTPSLRASGWTWIFSFFVGFAYDEDEDEPFLHNVRCVR
jgi:hypothetical protein